MISKLKPKSEFSRNVLTLMTGTTIAQAIPIAISPILTRIYTPEDFGIFALFLSITTLIGIIITGRYEMAIILPKRDEDARHIFILSLSISLFISIFIFVLILLFEELIINLLNTKEIENWLYFIPFTVLMLGIYQSTSYLFNRNSLYKDLAINKTIQSSSISGLSLISGYLKYNQIGLIGSQIFGQFIATFFMVKKLYKIKPNILSNINIFKIFILAKKHIDFLKINTIHSFINLGKDNITNILIINYFSTLVLGMYYLVIRVMKSPASLIGYSISQVFYKRMTEKFNHGERIDHNVKNLIKQLFLISFIPSMIFLIYSIDIFTFIFGKDWEKAGYYAQALIPYTFLHFIASPLGMIPIIVKKQKEALIWGVVESTLFVSCFFIGNLLFNDLYKTLLLLSSTMFIYFPIYFYWIIKISKVKNEQ